MAGELPVDPPLPRPHPRGLLEVSRILGRVVDGTVAVTAADVGPDAPAGRSGKPDWVRAGVSFRSDGCGDGDNYDGCTGPPDIIPSGPGSLVAASGHMVRVGTRCSTMGDLTSETRDRAVRALNIWQHQAVASEFWRGDLSTGSTPYLSDSGAVILGVGLSLIDGLGELEAAIGSGLEGGGCGAGQRATIHASVRTVTLWTALGLLRVDGGLLLTAMDSVIVTGPGYDGSATPGPGDAPEGDPIADLASDAHWAYATGFVDVRLGPAAVYTAVDRANNDRIAWADRPAAVTFDNCCQVGVSIDLTDRT